MAKSVDELSSELRVSLRLEFDVAPMDALFPQDHVAVVISCSPRWLELARYKGKGPPFVRTGGRFVKNRRGDPQWFGGRVLYKKLDVLAWLDAQPRFGSTSEYVPEQVAA